jgi:hypothetical protein
MKDRKLNATNIELWLRVMTTYALLIEPKVAWGAWGGTVTSHTWCGQCGALLRDLS